MFDDVMATSPKSVYRVLKAAGRLDRRSFSHAEKGTGLIQPLSAQEHWRVDVSHLNVEGAFCYPTNLMARRPRSRQRQEPKPERGIGIGLCSELKPEKDNGLRAQPVTIFTLAYT